MYAMLKQKAVLIALSVFALPPATAEEADRETTVIQPSIKRREATKFIRIQRDEYKSPVALQTATAKYVLQDESGQVKLEVFLEGVVHVADAAYYRGFNQRFRHYDSVLFELIVPEKKRKPKTEDGQTSVEDLFKQLTADSLGFVYQIDEIDYKAENMVHSDLSPSKMEEAKRRRGEDEFTMLADMLLDLSRRLNREANAKESDREPPQELGLEVFTDPDGAIKLRRLLAHTFDGQSPAKLLNPAMAASLIHDRNKRAMQVFQDQLDQGKRRIAFFWGAAHMPDFERRLILEYGMVPDGVKWRTAWDLREGAIERTPLESVLENTLRNAFDEALKELLESSRSKNR